mmetsp:Transcript_3933/g.8764  ORF Transcript_3933/g.8764 Transcript_3933/m.8764 type:complete len:768 (+) Transcript_3933:135-2438(+)
MSRRCILATAFLGELHRAMSQWLGVSVCGQVARRTRPGPDLRRARACPKRPLRLKGHQKNLPHKVRSQAPASFRTASGNAGASGKCRETHPPTGSAFPTSSPRLLCRNRVPGDVPFDGRGRRIPLRGVRLLGSLEDREASAQQRQHRDDEADDGDGAGGVTVTIATTAASGGGRGARNVHVLNPGRGALPSLQRRDLGVQGVLLVLREAPPLHRQHVLPRPVAPLGVDLELIHLHVRRPGDSSNGGRVVGQHLRGQLAECELREGGLPLRGQGVGDEGVEEGRGAPVHAGHVLLNVEVGEHGDGPGLGPRHVVEVHSAPVRVRGGDRARLSAQRRGGSSPNVGLRRCNEHVVLVPQRHLSKSLGLPVPRIQVPDGILVGSDKRGHATGPLHFVHPRRPLDGGPRGLALVAPLRLAGRVQVLRGARGAGGSLLAVGDLDLGARGDGEVGVGSLDVGMVPLSNGAGENLGQQAGLQIDGLVITLCRWHRVENRDSSHGEGDVHHLPVPELGKISSRHGDIPGPEVVECGVRRHVGLTDELGLAGAAAHAAVGHVDGVPGPILKEVHGLPEELGRVGGAAAVELKNRGLFQLLLQHRHLRLQVLNAAIEYRPLVLGKAAALARDHVLPSPCPGLRAGLKGELRHPGWHGQLPHGSLALLQHGRGQAREAEACRELLAFLAENHVKESPQKGGRAGVHGRELLSNVQVGHDGNGPRCVTRHVIQVNVRPISRRRIRRHRRNLLVRRLPNVSVSGGHLLPSSIGQGDLREPL